MHNQHDTVSGEVARSVAWIMAWFGTVSLADVQLTVSIISGLLVGGLAGMNLYITWRDKVRRRK